MAHVIKQSNIENNEELEAYHKPLTKEDIHNIRELYLTGVTQKTIASEYNIHVKMVYNITRLLAYKRVPLKKYPGMRTDTEMEYMDLVIQRGLR